MAAKRRAFGNIRQVGRQSWEARYRIGGEWHSAPHKFPAKADASAWLATVQSDIVRGVWTDPSAGKVTLRQFAERWLAEQRDAGHYRPRTLEMIDGLMPIILKAMGELSLAEVTTPTVRAWYAKVAATRSRSYAAKSYRLLRTIMNQAVADGAIVASPCTLKAAGNEKPSERPILSFEQIASIVDALNTRRKTCCSRGYPHPSHKSDERYEALVWAAALSGLREGELFALERRDVDVEHRTISVTKQAQNLYGGERVVGPPKSEAGKRVVDVPEFLAAKLFAHLANFVKPDEHALVFTSDTGLPLERSRWGGLWRRAVQRAGVEGAPHFHDLRHHAGTFAAQMGATTAELMGRLGHSTVRASMIYQQNSQRRQREIADRMDQALKDRTQGGRP